MDRLNKLKSHSLPDFKIVKLEEHYLNYDANNKYNFQIDLQRGIFDFKCQIVGNFRGHRIVSLPKDSKLYYTCDILDGFRWYTTNFPYDYINGITTFFGDKFRLRLNGRSHVLEYITTEKCYLILAKKPKSYQHHEMISLIKENMNLRIDGYIAHDEVHLLNDSIARVVSPNPEVASDRS